MLQPDEILYEAEVTATGGRDGKAASDDAHERCPYSNATRGNIDVKLTVL